MQTRQLTTSTPFSWEWTGTRHRCPPCLSQYVAKYPLLLLKEHRRKRARPHRVSTTTTCNSGVTGLAVIETAVLSRRRATQAAAIYY